MPGMTANHLKNRKGFALVATISVMVLLALVSLAMLSMATITIRESRQTHHMAVAKANARMALMVAIGELQKNAGPDQRITASSDIIEGATPGQYHWTGFWSTENWDPREPDQRDFLGWGVSHPSGLNSIDAPKTLLESRGSVTMVGPGSVEDVNDQVQAGRITVNNDGHPPGEYAWWIGDEGVKASFSAPSLSSHPWNKASLLATAAGAGVSALDLADYQKLDGDTVASSAISRNTMDLALGKPHLSRELFHDLTAQSITLLTDARNGGLRRDLSTAFELDRDSFDTIQEFHAGKERNQTSFYDELGAAYSDDRFYPEDHSPDLGYVCEIPYGNGFVRGPSWDLVRNHYRLYKKEWEQNPWARSVSGVPSNSFAARGSLPFSYSGNKGGTNDQQGDTFAYHPSNGSIYSKASAGFYGHARPVNETRGEINSKRTISRSPALTPRVIRFTVALGLVKKELTDDDWSLAVSIDPYLTIFNPYNTPITFNSIGLWSTKFTPFIVTVRYIDENGTPRTVRYEKYFSANYYSHGTFAVRLDPSQGPYTLEPGEVRVMSPAKIGNQGQLSFQYITTIRGSFQYSEDSGFYIAPDDNVKPKEGTTVTVSLNGRDPGWGATDRIHVTLEHTKTHTGAPLDIFNHFPPRNMYGDEDIFDQPLICNLGFSANDGKSQPDFFVSRSVNTSQIPQPGERGLYLGVLDVKMKTISEDFPSLSLNPRGQAFDTRDYEGSDRSSPQWTTELSQIDDLSQLQLVANPSGQSFWGEGRTVTHGSTHCVLYEIPELPMTSLAQLQHLNTGVTGSSGSLQVGNSFPHPGINDLSGIATQRRTVSGGYSSVDSQVLTDMAWATNEALWDRYFFSGINWGHSSLPRLGIKQAYSSHQAAVEALIESDRDSTWPLQNPRIGLTRRPQAEDDITELKQYDKIAKHLAVFGGFNINSTSQKAWKALFSSLRDTDISTTTSSTGAQGTPFSRFLLPTEKNGKVFGSYHLLSDSDIDSLATEMVRQVKARGPFMGLSDFVNRRLVQENVDGSDLASCGALQAAIEAANLNGPTVSHAPTASHVENISYQAGGKSRQISNYAGSSAYLLQADVLNCIGSVISPRSDTFLIRAYGASKDMNGAIQAEVWCEATLQRNTEWVIPTDEDPNGLSVPPTQSASSPIHTQLQQNTGFPSLNNSLGRRFKILSFRWLHKQEV